LDPSFHTVESLKWFVDRKIEDAESCVEINTRPLMAMTRIFADRMRKQVCAAFGDRVGLPVEGMLCHQCLSSLRFSTCSGRRRPHSERVVGWRPGRAAHVFSLLGNQGPRSTRLLCLLDDF
jgi:hypothetical protein